MVDFLANGLTGPHSLILRAGAESVPAFASRQQSFMQSDGAPCIPSLARHKIA
jgi:hypothetical protein